MDLGYAHSKFIFKSSNFLVEYCTMLQIRDLGKSYGSKTLFEGATVFLDNRSRVGLIGPNGAGKSTLIKMILGEEQYESGEISLGKNRKIGHLAQELPKFGNRTVMEEVMRLDGRREEFLKEKAEIEATLETNHGEDILNRYSEVLAELDAFDEYTLPSRAEQILEGVGFKQSDYHRNLAEFSGGWLMRVALARVLLLQPDLLILDEPTNHLDLESVLWLEEFLGNYPGAILAVSHDRAFLNRMITSVWEIDQRRINPYVGNLDAYVVQKEERMILMASQRAGQDAKIAEMQSFVDRFGAKATKARQAQSRVKAIEKLEAELIELPESRDSVQFRFPPCQPSGREVVTLKNAGVKFGEKEIFSKFDWILKRGTFVAMVGVNGAGKTTLLRALTGIIPFNEGSIKIGHNVQIGYYSQLQAESLNLESTILAELEAVAPKLTQSELRGVAGAFLFTGETVFKRIKVLSGGEKARVALAKLLLMPNNFLVLDEPTNHLDQESRAVLLEALSNYQGTLCLVSHDRDFVAALADELLEIEDHRVTPLMLNYEEYVQKKIRETKERIKAPSRGSILAKAAPANVGSESSSTKPSSIAQAPATDSTKKEKPSHNQVRSWEREFDKLEKEIALLEMRQGEISVRLSTEDFSKKGLDLKTLIEEQTHNQIIMDQKVLRWEEVGTYLGSN
jgi:ATP-binding cassette subfamily F protein 3